MGSGGGGGGGGGGGVCDSYIPTHGNQLQGIASMGSFACPICANRAHPRDVPLNMHA